MNRFLGLLLFILALALSIVSSHLKMAERKINELTADRTTLLESIDRYKINDSINVVVAKELTLTKSEFAKYKSETAKLIKELKADKLTSAVPVVIERKDTLSQLPLIDTIVVNKPYKHFTYTDEWNEVKGLLDNDSVTIHLSTKDELIVTEHIQRKKFLFFKLPIKMFGYKHKSVSVISKNPSTTITDVEFITVK